MSGVVSQRRKWWFLPPDLLETFTGGRLQTSYNCEHGGHVHISGLVHTATVYQFQSLYTLHVHGRVGLQV